MLSIHTPTVGKHTMRVVRIELVQKFVWRRQNALDDGACQEETL